MLKVNNKKTINKLAKSSFKANSLRNVFAIIAIILTTVLFTGLFTVVSSLFSSLEESTMRQVGSNSHGLLKYLSQEDYDKLKTHESIKSISYSLPLAIATNSELAKRPSEIRFTSGEEDAKGSFSIPTTGRLPQNDDEVATDTIVLDRLGVPAELGQQITLEYFIGDEKHSATFTLVGFWQGDKLMFASRVWLNRGYVEKKLENYIPIGDNNQWGTIDATVNFENSVDIEGKLKKLITESGYAEGEIAYGVNWAYTGNDDSIEIGTILGGIVAVVMIIFCGYLIISNVFYISVSKDIRFYGQLKTIGTTGKQIKFLIRRQALLLCAVGVPLGLIAGYFVGGFIAPVALAIFNTNAVKVSLNPLALAASALFAILTVAISISKPSKIAARVSPIEALRSTDAAAYKSKKTTKKSGGVNLFRMAFSNVSRNLKKAVLVTISLSLSLIILNSAYSMANSFNVEKYLSNMISDDFTIGDASCFNVHIDYTDQSTLNQEFMNTLTANSGIKDINNIYFAEPSTLTDPRFSGLPEKIKKELNVDNQWLDYINQALQGEQQIQHIYGFDDAIFEKLTVFEGIVDIEKLKTGKYVLSTAYDTKGKVKYYNVGDKVSITNIAGQIKEYEVLAIASMPFNLGVQHSHPITPEFFFPSNIFLNDIADKAPMLATLEVDDSKEAIIEEFMADYCENVDTNMQYISKASLIDECVNLQKTYKSVGLILSVLVAFIGIMNFVNTIITSIMSRKRELAMLQSIGMTNKQTEAMLIFEGIVYTALTALFTLTIGTALGYLAVSALSSGMYFDLRFTVAPSLLCIPALAIISALVPLISQRTVNKESVVERLRVID